MTRLARALGVGIVLMLLAAACGGEPPTSPSTALTGSLQAFSAKGDDFSYFFDISVTATAATGATVTSMDATITNPSSAFTQHIDLPLPQHVTAGATVAEPRIVIPNQAGRAYASAFSISVSYTDDRGRNGSLLLTAPAPTCQTFFYAATCAKTRLQVGEASTCSGFVEYGCQPMFFPLTASQIQWRSDAPGIATMTPDFRLIGVSNGSTTLTGTFNGVSTAIPVCVGLQCAPFGQ